MFGAFRAEQKMDVAGLKDLLASCPVLGQDVALFTALGSNELARSWGFYGRSAFCVTCNVVYHFDNDEEKCEECGEDVTYADVGDWE